MVTRRDPLLLGGALCSFHLKLLLAPSCPHRPPFLPGSTQLSTSFYSHIHVWVPLDCYGPDGSFPPYRPCSRMQWKRCTKLCWVQSWGDGCYCYCNVWVPWMLQCIQTRWDVRCLRSCLGSLSDAHSNHYRKSPVSGFRGNITCTCEA
jgi:hypothetical protein